MRDSVEASRTDQAFGSVEAEVEREALRIRAEMGAEMATGAASAPDEPDPVASAERTVADTQQPAAGSDPSDRDPVLRAIMAMSDVAQDPETAVGTTEKNVQSALPAAAGIDADVAKQCGVLVA